MYYVTYMLYLFIIAFMMQYNILEYEYTFFYKEIGENFEIYFIQKVYFFTIVVLL